MEPNHALTAQDIVMDLANAHALQIGHDCPAWIKKIAIQAYPSRYQSEYPSTSAQFYTEVCVRVPAIKINKRTGKPYDGTQRRSIDLVAMVQAYYKKHIPLIVGVEIKVSEHDLMNDEKLTDYLPYCHFFYLAVPTHLYQSALDKLKQMKLPNVGILTLDGSGGVCFAKEATQYQPTDKHFIEILSELAIRPFKAHKKTRPF